MLLAGASISNAKDYSVKSPDGHLQLTISVDGKTQWSMSVDGVKVMDGNEAAMEVVTADGKTLTLGKGKVQKTSTTHKSENIISPLYKQASFDAEYNELTLKYKDGYSLIARAYNDGVAYRFATNFKSAFTVKGEVTQFDFTQKYECLIPFVAMRKDRYETSFESQYTQMKIGERKDDNLIFTPLYINTEDQGRLLIMEADVEDYPGIFLTCTSDGFVGEFPPVPDQTKPNSRGVQRPQSYHDYIAVCKDGKRVFPWRIIGYGKEDKDLPVNNMVYALATPNRLGDVSWVEAGQSAWDWWNDWRRFGIDFEAGINTETYKYDIDFAAKYGIRYIVIDEGWYSTKTLDIMNPIEGCDIAEICKCADSKGVKVILWTTSGVIDPLLEEVCSKYASLGVAGFKIDFFDAQDQNTVQQIYRFCEVAAKHHLVLDLHGMYKPTGLSRTYPNVVNYEGVFGQEQCKWEDPKTYDQVRNDVTIPFIRQVAGPLDYTQGAIRNLKKSDWKPMYSTPASQGTRAHQVALYVIFDSPVVMLCDSPSDYLKEPETTEFITSIPAVFDEEIVLDGKAGEYVVIARRKGSTWYVGGATNWTDRSVEVDFSFLPGAKNARIFRDGYNSDRVATDYKLENRSISPSDKISFRMARGGGFAIIAE